MSLFYRGYKPTLRQQDIYITYSQYDYYYMFQRHSSTPTCLSHLV